MDSAARPTDSFHVSDNDANPPSFASSYDSQGSFSELMYNPVASWPSDSSLNSDLILESYGNYGGAFSEDARATGLSDSMGHFSPFTQNDDVDDLPSPSSLIFGYKFPIDFPPEWPQHEQEHQVYRSQLNANPLNSSPPMRTADQRAPPHDLGIPSEDSDISDESLLGGSNNRPKRGNAPLVNAPKSSCTCKRTKCLKLYCDCFSKNLHCGEFCACEGCYNTPVYEDSVYKALDLIESREPNAFSPKLRAVEGANCSTTSLVIHRRGCNCKKSLCEKKYCECYQAKIACSDKCRCEGCKNTYGTRNGYVQNAGTLNETARRDTSSADGMLEGTAEINRHRSNRHLSSSSPSLQNSMEIAAFSSHPTVSHNPLPNSVAETTES